MTYRISGLPRQPFEPLFGLGEEALGGLNARRVAVTWSMGFPCRVTLEDAEPGESVILLNYVSHDVPTPFRTAYAIYVREGAGDPPVYVDEAPDYLGRRTLGLRGFDAEGMLSGGLLALPGEADTRIRELFDRPETATIHAHNAAYGCFLARVERN